jgi:hypothetical protein
MGVSVVLQAPAALPLGEGPPMPIYKNADWEPQPAWNFWEKERLVFLPGLEARFLGRHYTDYVIPASEPPRFDCTSFH